MISLAMHLGGAAWLWWQFGWVAGVVGFCIGLAGYLFGYDVPMDGLRASGYEVLSSRKRNGWKVGIRPVVGEVAWFAPNVPPPAKELPRVGPALRLDGETVSRAANRRANKNS